MILPNNVMPQVGQATQQTYLPTGAAATYNPMNQAQAGPSNVSTAEMQAQIAANKKYVDEQYQLLKAQPYVKDEEFWKKQETVQPAHGWWFSWKYPCTRRTF